MAVTFPSDSDYDKDTWNLLAGFWHPVARVEDVRPKELTSAHLLGVPLVLYHTSIGLAVATDICPHRGARLSKGWMKGDSLVCPYHGLEFDSSGQCERVPAPHREPGGTLAQGPATGYVPRTSDLASLGHKAMVWDWFSLCSTIIGLWVFTIPYFRWLG